MKRLPIITILTISGIVILNSCRNDEPNYSSLENEVVSKNNSSNGRTIEEAAEIARQSISLIKDGQSRSGGRHFDISNVKVGMSAKSRGGNDTLMYVFNFDDNQGFSIVAYNKNIEGLIAVTEQGYYDPSVPTDNPGFELYMEMAREMLASVGGGGNGTYKAPDSLFIGDDSTHNVTPIDTGINKDLVQYKFEKKLLDSIVIEPNYNLKWGQTNPEGLLCPNGTSGCTNTAMAITMSYFEYPKSIVLTYEGQTADTLSLNWSQIKQHIRSSNDNLFDYCNLHRLPNHDVISRLCRQLAKLNQSIFEYNPNSTPTILGDEINTFKQLGYLTDGYYVYNRYLVLQTLKSGGILMTSGRRTQTTGHEWVIDGVKYERFWSGEYIKRWGEDWELVNDHGEQENYLQHINWGWNGNGNGYYSSTVYSRYYAYQYDSGCGIVKPDSITQNNSSYYNIVIAPIYHN